MNLIFINEFDIYVYSQFLVLMRTGPYHGRYFALLTSSSNQNYFEMLVRYSLLNLHCKKNLSTVRRAGRAKLHVVIT